MMGLTADPASFRDPDARVYHEDGRVLRLFNVGGAERFRRFLGSGLPERLCASGDLIESRVLEGDDRAALVVEHPRIPFISAAEEWPFGMLREAALLQLRLARAALEADLTLKDAATSNVQFIGRRPVQIDVSSFEPWEPGTPWAAYGQFCRQFLNPLLLTSRLGVPFQPWLRGAEEIEPEHMAALLPWYRQWGVLRDVKIHAWLNRRFSGAPTEQAEEAQGVPIPKARTLSLIARLEKTVGGMKPRAAKRSAWVDYASEAPYSNEARESKRRFVDEALKRTKPGLVWDLGCNTGEYSRMAARHARMVVAVDSDPETVDALYGELRDEKILCLVLDLTDLSGGRGWGGRARPGFLDRARPDFCLALSLIHHLCISANVPPASVVDWLADATPAGVIEFVPKEDPMVGRLLSWRKDVFDDYTRDIFERELERRFRVHERHPLPGSGRTLYAFERLP